MGEIYESVLSYFKGLDWPLRETDGHSTLITAFRGQNGEWVCIAKIREEERQFAFYSICPLEIPADKRQAIAELVTRANFGLIVGNFEFDLDDGELRFKTSIDVEGDWLSDPLIAHLVELNLRAMDQYLPGFQDVLGERAQPAEALARVEHGP